MQNPLKTYFESKNNKNNKSTKYCKQFPITAQHFLLPRSLPVIYSHHCHQQLSTGTSHKCACGCLICFPTPLTHSEMSEVKCGGSAWICENVEIILLKRGESKRGVYNVSSNIYVFKKNRIEKEKNNLNIIKNYILAARFLEHKVTTAADVTEPTTSYIQWTKLDIYVIKCNIFFFN